MSIFYDASIKQLTNDKQDMNESNKHWNRRAAEFSMINRKKLDKTYIDFLSNRATLKGHTVLDVGSGAGRFLAELLSCGALAEGLEPSVEMTKKAKEHLVEKGFKADQCVFHEIAFQDFTSKEPYDYLFIANNPMLAHYENYEKVKNLAKKGIFMGMWLRWEETLLAEVTQALGKSYEIRQNDNLFAWMHLFIHDGYQVDCQVLQHTFSEKVDKEQVPHRFAAWIFGRDYDENHLCAIREVLDHLEASGKLVNEVRRSTGMLYINR